MTRINNAAHPLLPSPGGANTHTAITLAWIDAVCSFQQRELNKVMEINL